MKYLFILSLFLVGCGPGVNLSVYIQMSEELKPYYNSFFQIVSKNYESEGEIVVSEIDKNKYGQCQLKSLNGWKITLNSLIWYGLTEDEKRTVLYHELTHCVFRSSLHSSDSNSYMYRVSSFKAKGIDLDEQVKEYTSHL